MTEEPIYYDPDDDEVIWDDEDEEECVIDDGDYDPVDDMDKDFRYGDFDDVCELRKSNQNLAKIIQEDIEKKDLFEAGCE